jgi:hypothetical protein
MAVYNVELRRSNGSNYEDKIYLKTSVGLVEGLLDENDKIRASLLPSFVLGSMRFVTIWQDTQNNNLEHLHTNVIDPYITSNGGSARGCYVVVGTTMQVSISNGYTLFTDELGASGPLPDVSGQITIERGDWLICINDSGKVWAVLNNTYPDATATTKGVVQLATEQDGINGTSTKLVMTPKTTVAAINARAYQHPTYTGNDLGSPLTGPEVISDINVNSLGHVTGFATRDLTLANLGFTGDSNANYYVHPDMTGMPTSLTLGPTDHISYISVDKWGHVTTVGKAGLPTAGVSTAGVVTLASSSEAKGGTNNSKALTPARAKEMIDKFASIPIVQSLPTDMSDHPEGKLILLQI